MKVNYNGIQMEANLIGKFKIDKAEYAVCSYEDDKNNNKIIIFQIEEKDGKIITKDIPQSDIEKVKKCFEEIKEKLLEE